MARQLMIQMEDGTLMPVSPNDPMSYDESTGELSKKKGLSELAKELGVGYGINKAGGALESAFAAPEVASKVATPTGLEITGLKEMPATQAGAFDLAGVGSAGNAILPLAGAVGLYDLFGNRAKSVGTGKGYLQGAASGAAMGSYFGPVGAAVGGGLGLLSNAFGGKSRTKQEEDNRKMLAKQGIIIPNADVKEWENNPVFKQSRQESDLTGKDIKNAAQFYMNVPGYDKFDDARKEAIANEALKNNLIRERRGQVEVGMNDAFQKYLQGLQAPAPTQSSGQSSSSRGPVREKAEKKAKVQALIPELREPTALAPRYDINLSEIFRNPYL